MSLIIKVIAGPASGQSFVVNNDQPLVVGRGSQSDTHINDNALSRIHFKIECEGNRYRLSDCGSSSGTFVDGERKEAADIREGCVIQAGNSRFRVGAAPHPEEDTVVTSDEGGMAQLKPLPQLVGDVFGPYTLTGIISKSHSGMVFKAHDKEKDRVAAVKVLSPQFTADDEQRQRFVRAMKTMLQVRDDRIIKLYHAGKSGPYCWAGMQYVDGVDLARLIEQTGIEGMLDWKKVWRIAVDVARALQAGYEHRIIHRNVTPTNIIRRTSDDTCLLGDFMLAKALEGTLAQQVTQPGQILGSIPYMAPERTMANGGVDTRSDLYGLGATCYALLTGRPPASGESTTDLIAAVRDRMPDPPKKFQLSVNEMFQDVVMHLLSKDPNERYQTPADLLKELARVGKFNSLEFTV